MWLGIDSSQAKGCGVAVWKGLQVISVVSLPPSLKPQSNLLPELTAEALQKSEITLGQLSGIAVAAGPGSYTGLRVSVSYAKGLCLALGLPLVAVSSLALQAGAYASLMETKLSQESTPIGIISTIDAGRDELYAEFFQMAKFGQTEVGSPQASTRLLALNGFETGILTKPQAYGKPILANDSDLRDALNIPQNLMGRGPIVVVGNAGEKLCFGQSEKGQTLVSFSQYRSQGCVEDDLHNRALSYFPFLAGAAYELHGPSSLADFEPAYLKPYFFRQTYMEPMTGEQA